LTAVKSHFSRNQRYDTSLAGIEVDDERKRVCPIKKMWKAQTGLTLRYLVFVPEFNVIKYGGF